MKKRANWHHFSRIPIVLLAGLLFVVGCEQQDTLFDAGEAGDKPEPELTFDREPPDGEPTIGKASGTQVIPGRYIIVFKQDGVGTRGRAQEIVGTHSGHLLYLYENALSGFSAELPGQAAAAIANLPFVEHVEQDREVVALGSQTNATWGLDRVDQRDLPLDEVYNYTPDGAGVTAYIIDTGIRVSHSEFGDRASVGYDAVGDGLNGSDCNGHGTHVAGTVGGATYGVAKNVSLVAVRVLNCTGSGTVSGVIAGVDWVTQHAQKPAVANMSLGGGASTALDDAVRSSINSGITYVVSAGNDNRDASSYSPARVDKALTVGSTTASDSRSSFSNYGDQLDLFAPGSSITSAWHLSNTATNTISGTSMASPHVAGAAALFLQGNASASPAAVAEAVTSTATGGRLTGIGSGSPNLLLYSLLEGDGGGTPPPPPPPDDNPCIGCETYTGSLSGSGDSDYQPGGTFYFSASGTHKGYLRGPSNADFDLYLYKWRLRGWRIVARSTSADSDEDVSFAGGSGYYTWRIHSYAGSGTYAFYMTRP